MLPPQDLALIQSVRPARFPQTGSTHPCIDSSLSQLSLSSSAGATISGTSELEGSRKKYPGKNTNKNAPVPIAAKMAIRMSVNRLRVEK
ncbi:MAG: hypothetical protein CMN54_00750 [SAR324 cluster bacterium]|uniref:Uncharacterized protein n=1 Tax=SAR324 cluster bacterium TaxID=2024889 RepID=A0A2D6YFM9_9DELT|nr:hypothetical protein [SAR324 cluster bacterium]